MDKVTKSVTSGKPKRKPPAKGGSRAGIPNKATANAREAIARFVDGNADRLQGWLDEIAQEQGALMAFKCFTDVVEYHVPKLARTTVIGDPDAPLQAKVTVEYVKPNPTA